MVFFVFLHPFVTFLVTYIPYAAITWKNYFLAAYIPYAALTWKNYLYPLRSNNLEELLSVNTLLHNKSKHGGYISRHLQYIPYSALTWKNYISCRLQYIPCAVGWSVEFFFDRTEQVN